MKKVMRAIKWHYESNALFRACYPEWCPPEGTKWGTEEEFTVPNRKKNINAPTLMTGSGGSPRTGFHYDLVINDDPHNEDNTNTPDQVYKVIEIWEKQAPLMKQPGKPNKRIQVGTIWDYDDLNVHVMRVKAPGFYKEYKDGSYKHPKDVLADNYPDDDAKVYILSCYTDDFGVTEERQSLWPEAWSLEELNRQREKDYLSDDFFNMQMRNMVITDKTRSFKHEWFNYFREDITYVTLGERKRIFVLPDDTVIPEKELVMRMTIDPAFRVKEHNDSTGFVIGGHWYDYETGHRVILIFDAFAEKLETNDLIRRIDDECSRWGIVEVGIEAHGLQFLFTDQLVEKTRHSWIGRNQINITKINRGSEAIVGKARVLRLIPFYERKQIYHAEHLRDGELEAQLMKFTGKMYRGKSPDIADAMSDQIDFPIAGGGMPYDPGNPRFHDRMHNMDRRLGVQRDPWTTIEDSMIAAGRKDDWKRR